MGETKKKVKEILLRRYSVKGSEEYIPAQNISEIDKTQKYTNFSDACHIGATKEIEYSRINPFARFFSHFVPNSWTKAGRLRNEIKECDEAFKEVGYTEDDLDAYYRKSLGSELYEANKVAHANRHFFSKSAEKELKEYAIKNKIAEPLDLTEATVDELNALAEDDPEPVYENNPKIAEDTEEKEEEYEEPEETKEEPDSGVLEDSEDGPTMGD